MLMSALGLLAAREFAFSFSAGFTFELDAGLELLSLMRPQPKTNGKRTIKPAVEIARRKAVRLELLSFRGIGGVS